MSITNDLSWIVSLSVVVVPSLLTLIGTVVTREVRVPRPLRSIQLMTTALKQTPQDSASYEALDSVLKRYIEDFGPVLSATKKINKLNVGMTVLLGLIALPSIYGLMTWALNVSGTGWQWVAWPIAVVVGLSLLILVLAGISTIYNPPQTDASSIRP